MRERINKPRVFLSHARKDVEFIEKIERDLRRCQIEPWRDQNEIRDGEPWQNVIFGEGIPTCDVIIAYYTENSLASQMVSKEVDASLLRQLSDNGIGFLPYVNSDNTRNNLRIDIQALHCRVWNEENYYEVLPSVVAEIWRRYMERSIGSAIAQEKSRRLEAELELEKLKSESIANANIKPLLGSHSIRHLTKREVYLRNFGRGTAIITSISFSKGQKVSNNLARIFDLGSIIFDDEWTFLTEKTYIAADETKILVQLTKAFLIQQGKSEEEALEILEKWQEQLDGIEIKISYEDILGNKQDDYVRTYHS